MTILNNQETKQQSYFGNGFASLLYSFVVKAK